MMKFVFVMENHAKNCASIICQRLGEGGGVGGVVLRKGSSDVPLFSVRTIYPLA